MNGQPFGIEPRDWKPRLSRFWIRVLRPLRRRLLYRRLCFTRVVVEQWEPLRQCLDAGCGVLLTPNHSFHWDSYVLIEASERVGRPFHFLAAWQVFAMSGWWDRWVLTQHGCFSINRERNDRRAFHRAVEIVRHSPYPLVVYPEGDIYHTNDRVVPFREGAAAIAHAAARRAAREIYCVPCALKARYVDDPVPRLRRAMDELEAALQWHPRIDLPLVDRIDRLMQAVVGLKELEHLGGVQGGSLAQRIQALSEELLRRQEVRYGVLRRAASTPERVREIRQRIVAAGQQGAASGDEASKLDRDLDDLFLVVQLYSYPGDYLAEAPSVERIAETIDKFQEDILRRALPDIHGRREVVVRFGQPLRVEAGRAARAELTHLTLQLQGRVQEMINAICESRQSGSQVTAVPGML